MPIEIGAYDRDTRHFTTRQHGAYFQLMKAGWVAGGRLMRSEAQLRIITGLAPAEWDEDRPVLVEKYRIDPDGAWVHEGMQSRMRVLGIPVDDGTRAGESGAVGAADLEPVRAAQVGADGAALSETRAAAARARWDAKRRGSDANAHAKPPVTDAKADANLHHGDANPDANLHATLNLNLKSPTNQPTSLDAARERGSGRGEAAKALVGLDEAALDVAEEVARIAGQPGWLTDGALTLCIGEWRAAGLSDDAICMHVQRVTDANRMQNAGWFPAHPNYFTKALKRAASSGESPDAGAPAFGDIWAQRVESYARTKFWLPDWGGAPDSDAPNSAISKALLAKHGFGKAA